MTSASPTYTHSTARSSIGSAAIFLALAGMMLMVTAFSLFFFSPQSLRLDEAQSLWQSSRSPAVLLSLIAEDVHVPLYHELLHFWRLYLGNSVESARLMSLLFFLLSLPAIYALGTLAYSRRVGLIAALFMSVSPFMNWYGNEIRMYTLFLLLTIFNQYCFLKLWREPTRDTWIGYGATAVLGIFTHYFFFLNLAAQALFYFTNKDLFPRHTLGRLMMVAAVLFAAFVPWAWYVVHLGEAGNQTPLLTIPTTVDVFNTFSQFVFGFQNDNLNTLFLSLWPIGIVLGFLALRRIPHGNRSGFETRYFLITVITSFAIAFAFSITVQPVFVSRYLIFTVPSLFLLLATFFETYAWRMATWATAALMFGMLILEVINPTAPVKEDYQGATAFLNTHAAPQDIVVVSVPFTLYPVEYYYTGSAPLVTLPKWDQYAHGAIPSYSSANLSAQVDDLAGSYQNIWLLQSYDQGYNEEVKNYFDHNYKRLQSRIFSPGLTLYEYQLRYDTPLAKQTSN